jgi:tetratricopeptide (TPR) repeat protein
VADASDRDKATAALVRAEALHRGRLADDDAIREAAQQASRETMRAASEVEQMLAMQISAEVAAESGNPEILRELGVHARRIADTTASSETRALAQLTRGYCFLVAKQWGKAGEALKACLLDIPDGSLDLERRRALNALGLAQDALGYHAVAIKSYQQAADLAATIGDLQGAASSCANLGVIYDHLGLFSSAATAYQRSLAFAKAASGHRRIVELYVNVTGLALSLGNTSEAYELITKANDLALRSRHWRLRVSASLAAADYYLATADPDRAWSIVEEVEELSHGRVYALDNMGRYGRLHRYYTWQRYGYDRMIEIAQREISGLRNERLDYQVEIRLFEEWVARKEGIAPPMSGALDRLKSHKLYGFLAGLIALGIIPAGVPEPEPGEAPARLVARLFPDPCRDVIPTSVLV